MTVAELLALVSLLHQVIAACQQQQREPSAEELRFLYQAGRLDRLADAALSVALHRPAG